MIIALPARAKLNLDLEVVGRRDDGFHDVRTTLQAIDLHDLLTLARAGTTKLTTSGLELSSMQNNTVLAAHELLEREAGHALPAAMHLHKRIPAGSGMGGASSDAAATLRGLARIYDLTLDLTSIAKDLGADVPFFLHGGTALAQGRGDRLTPIPTRDQWFAVAWPSIELRTPDVYRAWDDTPGQPPNHLTKAATKIEPRLEEFANALNSRSSRELEPGQDRWQMTGSGSAFFLRCASAEAASRVTRNLDCWTAVTHSVGAWT